jgi:protein-S-isoprenylcysteine O-methyltransferase Ste14
VLIIALLVEGTTVYVQQWISYPLPVTRNLQIGLTVILGGLSVAGMIWFNVSLNLITVNLLAGERTLVTHGPFNYVRHPLSATIVLTALPLTIVWSADGLFVVAWLVMLLLSHALVLQEERGLQEEFGDAYTTSRQYVPALLPYKGHGGKRYRTRHAQEHSSRCAGSGAPNVETARYGADKTIHRHTGYRWPFQSEKIVGRLCPRSMRCGRSYTPFPRRGGAGRKVVASVSEHVRTALRPLRRASW